MDNPIYFPINVKQDIKKLTKFVDKDFPNNINSLFNEYNPLRTYKAKPAIKNDFKDDPEGYKAAEEKYNNYLEYLKKFKEGKDEMEKKISSGEIFWKRVSDICSEEVDNQRKEYPINQN